MNCPSFSARGYELKLVITEACNGACTFCHQGQARPAEPAVMSEEQAFLWMDWAEAGGIRILRFTGGEPTLHPHLRLFCHYALLRGFHTILNTNGLAEEARYRELLPAVSEVRISLPLLDADRLDAVSGGVGALGKKLALVDRSLAAGRPVVLLTALLPEVKGRLHEFVELVHRRPGLFWVPLRFESTPALRRPWSRADVQDLAEEMVALMDRYPEDVPGIRNATPFCAVAPVRLGARVFAGRAIDCGPFSSLTVTAAGRLRSCYSGGLLPGGAPDRLRQTRAWRAAAGVEGLPGECRSCEHLARCRGGCRSPWATVKHGEARVDYLARFVA